MVDENFKYLGERSFEEMNLPETLYKYRNWSDSLHKTILTKSSVYMASPADFEDQYDCQLPIRYDLLTDTQILNYYLKESQVINRNFTWQQHLEFATYWTNKGLLKDVKRVNEFQSKFFEEFNRTYGVLSLTAVPDNIVMWDKYANNHQGFCVGFKTIPLLRHIQYFGGGGEVSYFDELPLIIPFDPPEKQYHLQIYSKERKYEFEKEYRLTKINIKQRLINVPENIYKEIVLGEKISERHKREIIEIVKNRFNNELNVYQSHVNGNKIKFNLLV